MKKLISRKNIRLIDYDYSQKGYYFITICTKNRECILSKIKKNVGTRALVAPENTTIRRDYRKKDTRYKQFIQKCNC